jgi:hypothetical protein
VVKIATFAKPQNVGSKHSDDMRTTIIFGLLICIGCVGQKSAENKDFVELRDKLPQIKTPISFNSDYNIDLKSVELTDNGLLKKLKDRNYFSVFGKIFETENFITIIGYIPDDTGTPILVTFDNDGNELDSHVVYETAMGDMGHYSSNYVTINPDREIYFTDSTTTRKINAEGTDEIPGTDSLVVTIKKYKLTDKGKIERVD